MEQIFLLPAGTTARACTGIPFQHFLHVILTCVPANACAHLARTKMKKRRRRAKRVLLVPFKTKVEKQSVRNVVLIRTVLHLPRVATIPLPLVQLNPFVWCAVVLSACRPVGSAVSITMVWVYTSPLCPRLPRATAIHAALTDTVSCTVVAHIVEEHAA